MEIKVTLTHSLIFYNNQDNCSHIVSIYMYKAPSLLQSVKTERLFCTSPLFNYDSNDMLCYTNCLATFPNIYAVKY